MLRKTIQGINVYIAKVTLTCPYEAPVEKFMVATEYLIQIGAVNKTFGTQTVASTGSAAEDCCVADPDSTIETGTPYSCDEDGHGGSTEVVYKFTRFKFYDSMPTGTINFTNADVAPDGCEFDVCGLDVDSGIEICFTGSHNPRPAEWMTPSLGSQDIIVTCDSTFAPDTMRIFGPDGSGNYIAYSSHAINISGATEACDWYCTPTVTDEKTFTIGTVDDPPGGSGCGTLVHWVDSVYSSEEGDPPCGVVQECDCYYGDDTWQCVVCVGDGVNVISFLQCFSPKAQAKAQNVISISFSQSLSSVTSQSICISAPSWSIVLS
jgi:hypothetical protein